ncbi:MAG: FAD-binding oxidoreductase [Candidatus Hydrogenedentes bacterium]|nr:FAD-binding oxidoreductase [Candidatus Hydrogenedentota bacterium]
MGNIAAAVQAWRELLPPGAVNSEDAVLDRYARSTQDRGTRPCCILFPDNATEVQAIVRIAVAQGVTVYPISRGKNWGYGDACAPTEGASIMDLSRMNRILEVNTELAYAVIEPGVTQGQLYGYLEERNTGLMMDCTGAGLTASLVGNTLDRGFGHTRYDDHFLTTCGMEVVLADGRILNTGFGHYPDAKATWVYRYGVGPFLDGLFCQSNLGIVTRIGLWLMPKPETATFFYVTVDRDEELAPLVDRLRPLRINGTLQTAVHIGNDLRMLSSKGRYPWQLTSGKTPLPEDVRARLRHEGGLGAWNAGGALIGTDGQVRAGRKALKSALSGLGKLKFVSDNKLAWAERVAPMLRRMGLGARLEEQIKSLIPIYGLLKGVPTDEPLLGAQWRLRHPPEGPGDPLDSGCGLMWVSPVLPMTGRAATEVMRIAGPIFPRHGFEPLVTFTMINERAMIGILNVAFDKAESEETARAVQCYDALFDALMTAGYIPYRVGPRAMSKLTQGSKVFWDLARQIKQVLDPHNVIAPGRYISKDLA